MIKRKYNDSKYNQYYYWDNILRNDVELWRNGFLDKPLTPSSIFINTVFIDEKKDFTRSRWAYFPDIYVLLGFVQYILMPTAIFTLLDDVAKGFNVPFATSEQLITIFQKQDRRTTHNLEQMLADTYSLQDLEFLPPQHMFEALRDFSVYIDQTWNITSSKKVYFKFYQSAYEVGDYVIQGDGNIEHWTQTIEAELGMNAQDWKELYQQVYNNLFLCKRFMNTLNDELCCLV